MNMYSYKDIVRKIKVLFGKYDVYTILNDWFKIMALSIRNSIDPFDDKDHQERELDYKTTTDKYTKKEIQVFTECFGMLAIICKNAPQSGFYDWLGQIYMESGTQSKENAQCFTPYALAPMMAENIIGNINKEKIEAEDTVVLFNDPAVGGGCLPIGFCDTLNRKGINYCKHALITCGDLDRRCFYMTYVQLSLIGAPARVFLQNAITTETYKIWDTPMLAMHWLRFKKYLEGGTNNG